MSEPTDLFESRPTRRIVFQGAFAGCALLALGACGGTSQDTGGATSGGTPPPTSSGSGGSAKLATVASIPVGGGVIFPDQGVVVTQPTKGDIVAFSASCTHQGFTVTSVSGGEIHCNHHGSAFSIKDGAVENGPATQPLAPAKVSVRGGDVFLG